MSNLKENKEIKIEDDEKIKLERIMKSYTNMMGNAGLQAIDAQEQIRKSFESMKDYKWLKQ